MQNLSFFKGIRNLLYSNFFSLLFQFFFTFLLIKSLSLTELGKFSFSLSLLSIIIHILSFGIRQSITIQLKKNNGLISIIINNIIFHITCISAISFFGYLLINYFFIIAESDLYLLGLSFILLSIIFSQINGIYLGLNMYDNYTINNLSVHFSKIIILLVINHFIIITSKIALIILILSHIAFLIFSFINLSSYT